MIIDGRIAYDGLWDQEAIDLVNSTHPGFDIQCQRCGSKIVTVESSLGYSEMSGSWGSIDLVCVACATRSEIYEP